LSEALGNTIEQKIEDGLSSIDLSAYSSRLDDMEDVIEWMYAGMKAGAGDTSNGTTSFSEIYAAGQSAWSSAISSVKTSVETLRNSLGDIAFYTSTA
jgi:hypothetical protein